MQWFVHKKNKILAEILKRRNALMRLVLQAPQLCRIHKV